MPNKQKSVLDQMNWSRGNRDKGGGAKKYGRNRNKCARYRARVGKPAGRGSDGQHKH